METQAGDSTVEEHLKNMDDLDFNVFSKQKWSEFKRSHSSDIKVFWPDGHVTKGLDRHIDDLKEMFSWAPDARVEAHPIRIGQGEWTAVVGVIAGTFTKPMRTPNGKTIQPTGKAYKLQMVTVGHWNQNGVMDEEHMFWDNLELMKQIGVAP